MKRLILTITFILFTSNVYAGFVLIRISDGVPIEYQSGNVTLATLLRNNPSYTANQVLYLQISDSSYRALHEARISKPARDARKARIRVKINKVKAKLGLTESEFNDLKEALQ